MLVCTIFEVIVFSEETLGNVVPWTVVRGYRRGCANNNIPGVVEVTVPVIATWTISVILTREYLCCSMMILFNVSWLLYWIDCGGRGGRRLVAPSVVLVWNMTVI